jgi:hypothetical protein
MDREPAKTIPQNRSLTSEELKLLTWLLKHGEPEAIEYLSQIPSVKVIGQCSCGCPTIDLAVGDKQATRGSSSTIIAEFCGTTPEGAFVGVMVHVREGILSELDVYSLSDFKNFSLPRPESLEPFGPGDSA